MPFSSSQSHFFSSPNVLAGQQALYRQPLRHPFCSPASLLSLSTDIALRMRNSEVSHLTIAVAFSFHDLKYLWWDVWALIFEIYAWINCVDVPFTPSSSRQLL